ncbi:MAG: two-component sensor histidine kinase, partial [Paucibacter sp.]|nr:two-component sensor histidine kinase [Roseateles sp.]
MDGFKKRLNASLQFKLSLMLSLAILLVAVVAGVFSFMSAFDEAQELQDDELRQVAQLMDRQSLLPPATDFHADEEVPRVVVQRLGDGGPLALPASLAEGMHTLVLDGETYRVLVRTRASGDRIAVAQESDLRDEIAREGALRTVMPFLILVPVLLLIVADLVRKMFRPMVALAQEIDLRAGQDLHPVDNSRLPAEVRPFAVAINRLLARVEQAMEGQRRFVADAAHELRSPLAALSLQAERLAQVDMSEVAQERLAMLRRGIARGSSLLDQLLSLARAQQA